MEMRGGKHGKPVESGVRIHIQMMRMPPVADDSEAGGDAAFEAWKEAVGADPDTPESELRQQWRRESGLDPSASTDEQPEGEEAGPLSRAGAAAGRAANRAGVTGSKRAEAEAAEDAEDEAGAADERERKKWTRRLNRGS